MRRHIAGADEGTRILSFVDLAVGIAIGALPFPLIAAVFAIGTVPVALIGRLIIVIAVRGGNNAVIADENAFIIGGLTGAIAILIALIISVPIDIVAGVLHHTIAIGQHSIVIVTRPAIAAARPAESVIAEVSDKIAGPDVGLRQAETTIGSAIAPVISHPSAANIVAGSVIVLHPMEIAHMFHAAHIAHAWHRLVAGCRRSQHGGSSKGDRNGCRDLPANIRVDGGNRGSWCDSENTGNASE